jgi:hypothetical protein
LSVEVVATATTSTDKTRKGDLAPVDDDH